jgi:hypothetical protein
MDHSQSLDPSHGADDALYCIVIAKFLKKPRDTQSRKTDDLDSVLQPL